MNVDALSRLIKTDSTSGPAQALSYLISEQPPTDNEINFME